MYPNVQAYDRGVMFSPDGRLFQVEYAKEAVRKGATSIGITTNDAVVLLAHKPNLDPLALPSTSQKIFRIDSYIGATYSGLVSDGLHVINTIRGKTQSHRMVYDETESVNGRKGDIGRDADGHSIRRYKALCDIAFDRRHRQQAKALRDRARGFIPGLQGGRHRLGQEAG